jgi:hypothetical protein
VFRGPELRRLTAEEFADAVASITGDWPATTRTIRTQFNAGPPQISGVPSDGAGVEAAAIPVPVERPFAPFRPLRIPPPVVPAANYVREWRIAGSPLDRALGRPIRDQVYSTRDTQATTLQALELVNGERLTHWLWRGARNMLGELPPEPASLIGLEIGTTRRAPVPFHIDISQSQKLYLIVEDNLSTAPEKAAPLWITPELSGPGGTVPLTALTPLDLSGLREGAGPADIAGAGAELDALRVKLSSVLVYDIAGKGFTRFDGAIGFEPVQFTPGLSAQARFFVFDRQPSMDRLGPMHPEKPLPAGPPLKTVSETVERVYQYALGRAPTTAERRIAERALRDPAKPGTPSADGLADLLWAILMTPEFQLIQ